MTKLENWKTLKKFEFKTISGWFTGYGKTYRQAARNLNNKGKKSISVGMLVIVRSKTKWGFKNSYWDGREFIKELKRGSVI